MKRHLHKFETTMWLIIKGILYLLLMAAFIVILGRRNVGLTRPSRMLAIVGTTFVVVGLLFLYVYGGYDVGRKKSRPIIYSLVLAVGCTDVITYLELMIMRVNDLTTRHFQLNGVGHLCLVFVIQVVIIIAFTYFGNWLFFKIHDPERCLVVTDSQESLDEIAYAIGRFQKQYRITKVLDYHDKEQIQSTLRVVETVFAYNIPMDCRADIMNWSYKYNVNVYFNPEIWDIVEVNAKDYVLDDVYLMNKNVKSLTIQQRVAKRLLDIVLSVVIGVITSPFWLIGMIAVKAYDGGPVIFKQERATIHGKRFNVYKIRTMRPDAGDDHSVTQDDDRITPPGRVLRRFRIDELPQLWNVFVGDMTFVGPRPEMIKNVEEYTEELPEFKYRLRVKAGLTGYAQIMGKYNTSPKEKLIMDMMYIEQFSIMRDLQLIFQTAIAVFSKESTEAFGEREHCGYTFVPYESEGKSGDHADSVETDEEETVESGTDG